MGHKFVKTGLLSAMIAASANVATVAAEEVNTGWYGEFSILNVEVDDSSFDSSGRNVNADFDDDLGFGFAAGYRFKGDALGAVRLELEYIRTSNDTDRINFNGNNFSGPAVGGQIESDSIFFNVAQEFNIPSYNITPYIGAGIGYSDVDSSISYGPVANINDDDTAFAYQFFVGVDVKLSKQLTGFAEYKFVRIDDLDLDRFGGGPGGILTTEQEGDLDFDAFTVGLRYSF